VKYPYLNGGMRGTVTVKDDQIDPQPRASSPRAALPPLRGAKITGFKAMGKETNRAWSLEYTIAGKKHLVNYRLENGKWIFDFVDPQRCDEDRDLRRRPPAAPAGWRGRPAWRRRVATAAPAKMVPVASIARLVRARTPVRPCNQHSEPGTNARTQVRDFALSSPDVTDGRLSIECTCDGASRSPALSWGSPPEGTKAFAVVMHHITRDNDTHVYMVVANIPAAARELKSGDAGVGGRGARTPSTARTPTPRPARKGPGDKTYTHHALRALSGGE
jgi:hypothetical protein